MHTAACIIGSGPNGLSVAIVLAAAGFSTTVFERNVQIGGACSTAENMLPNFRQDLEDDLVQQARCGRIFERPTDRESPKERSRSLHLLSPPLYISRSSVPPPEHTSHLFAKNHLSVSAHAGSAH
jgi:flavin-dependent dehydrogenase